MTPAAQLLDKAVSMLRPGDKLALCSDAEAYPGTVLLAVARPDSACVLQIDAAEYSGAAVFRLAGFGDVMADHKAAPDIEDMRQQRQALRTRKTTKTTGVANA